MPNDIIGGVSVQEFIGTLVLSVYFIVSGLAKIKKDKPQSKETDEHMEELLEAILELLSEMVMHLEDTSDNAAQAKAAILKVESAIKDQNLKSAENFAALRELLYELITGLRKNGNG